MAPRFKYIVVGAGMMGAAAARHLSEESGDVALIGPPEPDRERTMKASSAATTMRVASFEHSTPTSAGASSRRDPSHDSAIWNNAVGFPSTAKLATSR